MGAETCSIRNNYIALMPSRFDRQADQDDLAVHIKSDKGAQYLAFDYLELTAYF